MTSVNFEWVVAAIGSFIISRIAWSNGIDGVDNILVVMGIAFIGGMIRGLL